MLAASLFYFFLVDFFGFASASVAAAAFLSQYAACVAATLSLFSRFHLLWYARRASRAASLISAIFHTSFLASDRQAAKKRGSIRGRVTGNIYDYAFALIE